MIPYELKRSRRKTIAIHILPDGRVEVRAPLKLPKYQIEQFVAEKTRWIEQHRQAAEKRCEKRKAFTLRDGSRLRYLGQDLPLMCCDITKPVFDGTCFYLPQAFSEAALKEGVVRLYREQAKKILTQKTAFFAGKMGAAPTAVKINGAKTRWGSCSGKNSLNFSWKLIMAPESAVDYVVVHELAHTFEHNHSAAFWRIVGDMMPDYKEQQACLKRLAQAISAENWDT